MLSIYSILRQSLQRFLLTGEINELGDHVVSWLSHWHSQYHEYSLLYIFCILEHVHKVSFWVWTRIMMSCYVLSWCNTNTNHHRGRNTYITFSDEYNRI